MKQALIRFIVANNDNENSELFWEANRLLTLVIRSEPYTPLKTVIESRASVFWYNIPNTLFREAVRKNTRLPYFEESNVDVRFKLFYGTLIKKDEDAPIPLTIPNLCHEWKEQGVSEYDFLYLISTMRWINPKNPKLVMLLELANRFCFTGGELIKAPWTKDLRPLSDYDLDMLLKEFFIVRHNFDVRLVIFLCNMIDDDDILVSEYEGAIYRAKHPYLPTQSIGEVGGIVRNERLSESDFEYPDLVGQTWYVDSSVFWKLKEKGRFIRKAPPDTSPNVQIRAPTFQFPQTKRLVLDVVPLEELQANKVLYY